MIYITSDQHFNHHNIISYTNRKFTTVDEMNNYMIKKWNETVSSKDHIYHLGDFAWGNKLEVTRLVNLLSGYKTLILGNHDKHSSKWYQECGFDNVVNGGVILDDYYLLTHKPIFINEQTPYLNIHGHTHQNSMEGVGYFNVCVEQNDYKPFLFEDIKNNC